MAARFTQLENNGWKLTNSLGFILQDRALGVLEAREISDCTDCLCPKKVMTCLKVPCNLLASRCQNITLPLFDAATRAPFRIKQGTLIDSIIVMKRPGACLDNCLHFVLGTICGSDCDTECDPQRWATESCPISGAQLNKCGVIRVNAARKCKKNCPIYLCRCNQCPGECGPRFRGQQAPCDDGIGQCRADRNEKADSCDPGCFVDPETGCPVVVEDENGCCSYCGPCDFAAGELADCMLAITTIGGDLLADQLLIGVESWQRCCFDDCSLPEEICSGVPVFSHGGF